MERLKLSTLEKIDAWLTPTSLMRLIHKGNKHYNSHIQDPEPRISCFEGFQDYVNVAFLETMRLWVYYGMGLGVLRLYHALK